MLSNAFAIIKLIKTEWESRKKLKKLIKASSKIFSVGW